MARKLEKHCKGRSTENKIKMDEVQEKHLPNLLNNINSKEIFKNESRLVIILDNAPGHYNDYIFQFQELLNIYLLYLPPRSPELNIVECGWDSQKYNLSGLYYNNRDEVINKGKMYFNRVYENESMYEKHFIKYHAEIC